MTAVVDIEPMRRRHLPAVMRIERRANPKPWSLAIFAGELAQGDERYYVVAKLAGRLSGYGGLMFVADEAHLTNIAVGPWARRRGIGTSVLAHLASESVRRHCSSMTLEVRTSNQPAQELYRKFGFVCAGVRPNYYPETAEDGLIMWLYELGAPEVQERLHSLGAQW